MFLLAISLDLCFQFVQAGKGRSISFIHSLLGHFVKLAVLVSNDKMFALLETFVHSVVVQRQKGGRDNEDVKSGCEMWVSLHDKAQMDC